MPLPLIPDSRGNLTFIQQGAHIDFAPLCWKWVYGMAEGTDTDPGVSPRHRIVIALAGSISVGDNIILTDPHTACLVPPGENLTLHTVSANGVALIIEGEPDATVPPTPVGDDSGRDTSVDDAYVTGLPTVDTREYRTTAVAGEPIAPVRAFYLYDIPAGATRGGHSHKKAHEIIVAVSGSFDVQLDDGERTVTHRLNDPAQGLYIPNGLWRTIDRFSDNAVCLVLTTELFSEEDYIRDYDQFKESKSDVRN